MRIQAVGINRCIGAECHLHSAGEGVSDVLARGRHHGFGLDEQKVRDVISFGILQKPVGQVKRGHKIGAVLFHLRDARIVNVRAVLDGIHASL